jgi:hypothetical protein
MGAIDIEMHWLLTMIPIDSANINPDHHASRSGGNIDRKIAFHNQKQIEIHILRTYLFMLFSFMKMPGVT